MKSTESVTITAQQRRIQSAQTFAPGHSGLGPQSSVTEMTTLRHDWSAGGGHNRPSQHSGPHGSPGRAPRPAWRQSASRAGHGAARRSLTISPGGLVRWPVRARLGSAPIIQIPVPGGTSTRTLRPACRADMTPAAGRSQWLSAEWTIGYSATRAPSRHAAQLRLMSVRVRAKTRERHCRTDSRDCNQGTIYFLQPRRTSCSRRPARADDPSCRV